MLAQDLLTQHRNIRLLMFPFPFCSADGDGDTAVEHEDAGIPIASLYSPKAEIAHLKMAISERVVI